MIVTFVFVWFVGGLSGFHCYLVATNQTTYENFRYNNDDRPNPYDEGLVKNCMSVWCMTVPPSKVDFRAFLETSSVGGGEGDVEGGRGGDKGGGGGSIARHSLPPQPQPPLNAPPNPQSLQMTAAAQPLASGASALESRENASLSTLKMQLADGRVNGGAAAGSTNGAASLTQHASLREIEPAV